MCILWPINSARGHRIVGYWSVGQSARVDEWPQVVEFSLENVGLLFGTLLLTYRLSISIQLTLIALLTSSVQFSCWGFRFHHQNLCLFSLPPRDHCVPYKSWSRWSDHQHEAPLFVIVTIRRVPTANNVRRLFWFTIIHDWGGLSRNRQFGGLDNWPKGRRSNKEMTFDLNFIVIRVKTITLIASAWSRIGRGRHLLLIIDIVLWPHYKQSLFGNGR